MSSLRLSPLFLLVLFAALFTACEEDPKKEDPFKQGSLWGPCYDDGTCDAGLVCKEDVCWEASDSDLLTDDLIPDEEEDDAKTDTKTDLDAKDADTADVDTKDTDTTDADVVTGPCASDPCAAILHSDGVCTADGDDYDCGCEEHYTWDGDNKLCAADTQRIDCVNIPDNATGFGDNADGKFEQAWDGDSWEPAEFLCEWVCDENYALNDEEDGCIGATRRVDCADIPDNAHGTGDNADGKFAQTWDGDSYEPATATCTWACNDHHTWDGDSCEPDTQRANCTNIPLNGHGTGDNADGKIDQTWGGSAWLPAADTCTWECDLNYTANGQVCDADTQRVDCTNIPANAHGTGDNADGKFLQTWDGSDWLPGSVVCAWECDTNFTENLGGDACVADTRPADCANIPTNAHGIGDNADGKFTQTWDGDSWEPATYACEWDCDEHFTRVNDLCEADTQRVACANIPLNAHGTGDNFDGKFEQEWSGTEDMWLPETFECTWACDTNYTQNGNACDANTREADCANTLPAHAGWSGDNENGTFIQTWSSADNDWMPTTFDCLWTCDENYSLNATEDGCDADERIVDCEGTPPEHASWSGDNADGKITQVWDGDSWEPAATTCVWACDENYSLNDTEDGCDPDTRRVDCENAIPEHAAYSGANDDGQFAQTWGGGSWEPATFECDWDCAYQYEWNEGTELCDLRPVIYVDLNAIDGENTGYSWTDAFVDLQDALDSIVDGQEIWVAAGIYTPTACPYYVTCTEKQKNFNLVNRRSDMIHYRLYGGFDGTETARDDRDWATNVTVLSGDMNGDDAWDDLNGAWTNREDNTYHVLLFDPLPIEDALTIDGFTVTGGEATGEEGEQRDGGGFSLSNHTVTIRNLIFIGNSAAVNGNAFSCNGCDVTVEDSYFFRNIFPDGTTGGGTVSVSGTLSIARVTFEENRAPLGAVSFNAPTGGETLIVADTDFLDNSASVGTAAISGAGGAAIITGCAFIGNVGYAAGAVALNNVGSAMLDACYFENNAASSTEPGNEGSTGALSVSEGSFSITDSQFIGNTAYRNAAISLYNIGNAAVFGVDFIDNIGYSNGALAANTTVLMVGDCVFSGNEATSEEEGKWGNGGAISCGEGALTVINSTFSDNSAFTGGVIQAHNAALSISNSSFDANVTHAPDQGGNVSADAETAELLIEGSSFTNNFGAAVTAGGGQLVQIFGSLFSGNHAVNSAAIGIQSGSSALIADCRFIDNAADVPGEGFAGLGGAIMVNGMDDETGGPVEGVDIWIANSVFDGNRANLWGGAIFSLLLHPVITSCTFHDNLDSGNDAIVFVMSDAIIDNSVIWDKMSVLEGEVGPFNFGPSNPTFSYSDVRYSGGSGNDCGGGSDPCWVLPFGTDGGGNIDADPLFVGSGSDPLDLQGTSPCIDAGSNALVPPDLTMDILGDARIQNTTVDMGAYEQ